jgi:hypothetical protein
MGEQISMLLPTDSYLLNQSITACLPRKKNILYILQKFSSTLSTTIARGLQE